LTVFNRAKNLQWKAGQSPGILLLMASDEKYILDICDQILEMKSLRQHRFDFLIGLPSLKTGKTARLPVDAFYPDRNLVIEYHERQHSQEVAFFNRRITACGIGRGEQRKLYDAFRADLLPANGIQLLILKYSGFDVDARGRIRRGRDEEIRLQAALAGHLNP
jgi:hypothetical protein